MLTGAAGPVSIRIGVEVPGVVGLNVTSYPAGSTAVHWVVDGHATPVSGVVPSIRFKMAGSSVRT